MAYVNIYVDLRDFDDDDLIEELERRGCDIPDKESSVPDLVVDMIDWFRRGDAKEAMILLERMYPDMHGISDRVV